jgi:hypothetical protein
MASILFDVAAILATCSLEFEAFPSCSTKQVHGKKFSSDIAEQALAVGQLQGRPGIN